MSEPFFPFTIGLPANLVSKFRKVDNETWFEADLEVTSASTGVVHVYGMYDSYRGGRGRHLRDVTLLDIGNELGPHIARQASVVAERQIAMEDDAELKARIQSRALSIMEKLEANR